jgi:hypothetical protein
MRPKRARLTPVGSTATRRFAPAPGRPAIGWRASQRDAVAGRSMRFATARESRPKRACPRSVPWKVTIRGAPRRASVHQAVMP